MATDRSINDVVTLLRQGGVIAYPSDTVYGLGAAISNVAAVRRIYELKGRDRQRPLLIAVADFEMLTDYCAVSPAAINVLRQIWPSAISVLLPPRDNVPSLITAGRPQVGVRMPLYPLLRDLIKMVGEPITTTSANLSGQPDVCEAEKLSVPVDYVILGECRWKIPSTLVDLAGRKILRRGAEVERAEKWLASLPNKL